MKILFDGTELSYYNDKSGHRAGVFYVALNLLEQFKQMGIDITFVCDYKRYYFLKNVKEFENIPLLNENSFLNKLWGKIIYYTDKFPIRIKYAILILARFYDAYLYRINKKNAEEIKDFDLYFSPYTPPKKEIQDGEIKKFRMIHDTIPIIESGYPKSPKDWYYKIYKTISNGEFYFANSECTKQDVLKYYPKLDEKRIKTTLLGKSEIFNPNKNDEILKKYGISGKYVFSLCTLGKRKNLEFTVKNFFKFIEENKIDDLKLVLTGGIWKKYSAKFNKFLENYDKSKIILTGYIEDKYLPPIYSSALTFVFPSLYEGFGLPVLEAMSCGCPVITSNISSLPEVIGDSGIKINPANDDDLKSALHKMYYDNDFRENCSKKGLERANLFSWRKCASEIIKFMEQN